MSLLYTKGDKIFIQREGTIEMPNRSHFAARRKRNLTVPLLALFLLIGFAAGLAVPRLGSSAPAVSAADGTASGEPDSSASSPDASAAVYIAPDDAAATAYISRAELEVAVPSFETVDELTETHVLLELEQLAAYFEDGRYWNHYGMDASSMNDREQALCITDQACAHSENGYDYCNTYNGAISDYFPQYDYDTQCLGYAALISDLLFGTDAPVTEFYDFDSLRIGDHIRLVENEHSMIVTDIDWSTDTITVTEVNADYENCRISWGRTITRDELYSMEGEAIFHTRYID